MIKKKSSKTVYKNPWMEVKEDKVEFSNGHEGIYGHVLKDEFALIIPYDGEKFYLVKQYRYPIQEYSIEFPQGAHEDEKGTKPLELAQAELQEETGYSANIMEEIGYMKEAPGYCNQGFHIYFATDLVEGDSDLEDTEVGLEKVSMTRSELEQKIMSGDITDAPTIAAYGLLKLKNL